MLALGSAFTGFTAPAAPALRSVGAARAPAAEAKERSLSVAGQEDTKVAYYAEDGDFAYGLPGCIPPMNAWDPWNFLEGKTQAEVYKYREAELAHGRVAMLASLGFLVQEFYHPLFSPEITNVAINQIPELPPVFWFALTLGISAAEITRIQLGFANPYEANVKGKKGARDEVKGTLKEGYYPGDLRFDPLNIKPTTPDAFRQMQVNAPPPLPLPPPPPSPPPPPPPPPSLTPSTTPSPCRSASSRTAASRCSPPPASSRRRPSTRSRGASTGASTTPGTRSRALPDEF
jgi:hypothetical protein